MKKKTTIKDIARALGCSHATVSMALHDNPLIPEKTRKRVLQKAKAMHYAPNRLAQQLKTSHSRTVGLLMDSNYFAMRRALMPSVEEQFQKKGYRVIPSMPSKRFGEVSDPLDEILSLQVDGVVAVVRDELCEEYVKRAKRQGRPIIFTLGIPSGKSKFDSVTVDREEGVYRAIRHLWNLGHRKIGFPYNPDDAIHTPPKISGYKRALEEGGAKDLSRYLYPRSFSTNWIKAGYEWADEFLKLSDRPTAVFLPAAQITLGFFSRIRRSGLHIPDDVAIIGYENMPEAQYLEVAVTTVEIPVEEMTETLVNTLLLRIDSGTKSGPSQEIILPHRLVVRESCGGRPVTKNAWSDS